MVTPTLIGSYLSWKYHQYLTSATHPPKKMEKKNLNSDMILNTPILKKISLVSSPTQPVHFPPVEGTLKRNL